LLPGNPNHSRAQRNDQGSKTAKMRDRGKHHRPAQRDGGVFGTVSERESINRLYRTHSNRQIAACAFVEAVYPLVEKCAGFIGR